MLGAACKSNAPVLWLPVHAITHTSLLLHTQAIAVLRGELDVKDQEIEDQCHVTACLHVQLAAKEAEASSLRKQLAKTQALLRRANQVRMCFSHFSAFFHH